MDGDIVIEWHMWMFTGNTKKILLQQDLLHALNMLEFVNSLSITLPFDMKQLLHTILVSNKT
jgi:hypothetical protein